jgi:hypothetical protein
MGCGFWLGLLLLCIMDWVELMPFLTVYSKFSAPAGSYELEFTTSHLPCLCQVKFCHPGHGGGGLRPTAGALICLMSPLPPGSRHRPLLQGRGNPVQSPPQIQAAGCAFPPSVPSPHQTPADRTHILNSHAPLRSTEEPTGNILPIIFLDFVPRSDK